MRVKRWSQGTEWVIRHPTACLLMSQPIGSQPRASLNSGMRTSAKCSQAKERAMCAETNESGHSLWSTYFVAERFFSPPPEWTPMSLGVCMFSSRFVCMFSGYEYPNAIHKACNPFLGVICKANSFISMKGVTAHVCGIYLCKLVQICYRKIKQSANIIHRLKTLFKKLISKSLITGNDCGCICWCNTTYLVHFLKRL